MAPRPSNLSPPSSDLSDSCCEPPSGGSGIKLRHQDHHHCHHLNQIRYMHANTPAREALFSNYSKTIMLPPSPDLSDTCWKHGRRKLHFQVTSYGTKTITTVTTVTRSIFGNPYSLGYLNYFFDGVCDPRSETPTHIYKNFSPSQKGWFDCFFKVFENWDPFLRVFHLENSWFFKKI